MANDPIIILTDEPTGNLDSKSGDEILDTLGQMNEEGKTLIVVTHDEGVAARAQRIVRFKDGRIQNGRAAEEGHE
jgi:putative ABC transport system ATP-binding protein